MENKKHLEKKIGFKLPPSPIYEGTWRAYPDVVEFTCTCHLCGTKIGGRLHGKTYTMTQDQISQAVLQRIKQLHDCPVVKEILNNSQLQTQYYRDVLIGSELLKEHRYKILRGLIKPNGKSLAKV